MFKKINFLKNKNNKQERKKCYKVLNKKEDDSIKNNEGVENQFLDNNQNIIKKMSRKELLQLLIIQRKKIEELESELVNVKEKLLDKEITIKNAGSIALASLKLNKIFEKAQEAADQYLENVKKSVKISKKK